MIATAHRVQPCLDKPRPERAAALLFRQELFQHHRKHRDRQQYHDGADDDGGKSDGSSVDGGGAGDRRGHEDDGEPRHKSGAGQYAQRVQHLQWDDGSAKGVGGRTIPWEATKE